MATGTRHTAATRRTEPKSADAPEPQLTAADAPGMPIRSRLQSRQRPQSKCELGVYFYLCGDYEDPANGIESLVNRMREQAEAITAAPLDPQIGVAIQLDGITGPGGRKVARRWARNGSSDPTDDWEDIGPINTGSEKEFENFLVWADQICPARRVVLMIAGMGIFENSHALSGERWSHLFSICDDSSNRDSMDLVDFGAALRQFVRQRWQQPAIRAKARRRARASTPKIEDAAYSSEDETQRPEERKIDVIAFDMGDIQCFELALELEGSAQVVVAPQRRAIPGGWNYRALLEDWSIALRDRRSDSRSLGEILVKQAMQQPALPWAGPAASAPADPNSKDPISAVDLDCMGPLSSTFDEFTVALTTNLGDELVWRMRSDTLRALWQGDPAGRPANGHSYAPYDVGEMLLTISNHAGRDAERPVTVWLEIKLFSIVFSSRRQQSPWFPELRDAIVRRLVERRDPTLPDPDRIWTILTRAAPTEDAKRGEEAAELHFFMCEDGQKPDAVHERMFEALLREAVEDVLDVLPPDLREEYLRLDIPRRQLRRIADLADNARRFLQPDRVSPGGTSFVIAVSNEAQRADTPTLPCGLWIFRPAHVDELRDLTYLSLRFHDRVHWAAYLTAVGLIRMHPIALWRLVASMLSSSNPFARAEIQRLITGPNAELIGFRKQLRVLSAPSSASITIDEREETTRPGRNGNESPPAKQERKKKYFWIRLASHMPGATIPEQRSRVQEQTFERAVEILERILDKPRLDAADVQQFHAVGAALGADVFQDLRPALRAIEEKWAEASRCCNLCDFEPAHLQIQVPQELMRFPWELLNDGTRWLCSRFAIGRSAFVDAEIGRRSRSRHAGGLRVLVIGDPDLGSNHSLSQLPGAREEAEKVVEEIQRFQKISADVEFDREIDAYIGERIECATLRDLIQRGGYDIIHFSGHAIFDKDEPSSSGWLLSDGLLTALEIRSTLAETDTPPWLVYANACGASMDAETRGYPRDVSGLATAFVNSGVAAYIGPMWPIQDGVASTIGVSFYRELLQERRTLGTALWKAKRKAREQIFDDPDRVESWSSLAADLGFGWASSVLYGDSTATVLQLLSTSGTTRPPLDRKAYRRLRTRTSSNREAVEPKQGSTLREAEFAALSGPQMARITTARRSALRDAEVSLDLVEQNGVRFWRKVDPYVSERIDPNHAVSATPIDGRRGAGSSARLLGRWLLGNVEGGLAEAYDRNTVEEERLVRVDSNAVIHGMDGDSVGGAEKGILLLCHGTFSSTAAVAIELGGEFFAWAYQHYRLVLGFDHWTLSQTPGENAKRLFDFLKPIVQTGERVDAIGHSRGGLVLRAIAQDPNDANRRQIFRRVALVTCPNQGTPLAQPGNWGSAADLFVNWLQIDPTGVAGKLAGFLAQLVARGIQTGVPGLAAMDPGSRSEATSLLYQLSGWRPEVTTRFGVVALDYLAGRDAEKTLDLARQKLVEAAADAFFQAPNDLVVDVRSHWQLALPSDANPLGPLLEPGDVLALAGGVAPAVDFPANVSPFQHLDGIHHTNVFESIQVRDFLQKFLLAGATK